MTYLAYRCRTGKTGSVPMTRASVDRQSTPVNAECTWLLFCNHSCQSRMHVALLLFYSHSCQYRMHVALLLQSLVSMQNARGSSSAITRVNTECTWLFFCNHSCQSRMHVALLLQSLVSIQNERDSSSALSHSCQYRMNVTPLLH